MRALITLAVLALLSAQLEFVSDFQAYVADSPGQEHSATLHDHDPAPGDMVDHDGCDHCCHGAGHLTGIVGDQFAPILQSKHNQRAVVRAVLASIFETPPVPPPIV